MDRRYDELIKALENGGPEAMERLLMDAQSLAYRFSVVVCGNVPDAEDAMQDALLQTYRRAKNIRDPRAFRAWLYRTVKNACLMSRRPHARHPPRLLSLEDEEAAAAAAGGPSPEDLAGSAAERQQFHEAFQTLPKNYRLVLFLRDIEGLSTEEVAKVAGISADNVKQRLHRARAMLRRSIEHRLAGPQLPPDATKRARARVTALLSRGRP